jgi:uncharacterized protein
LGGVDTYHTRPMSEDWSKLRDADLLADGHVTVDFEIPLAEFPRLQTALAHRRGSARGHVRFARESGTPVADVEVAARVALTCQRCLGPLTWAVSAGGKVAVVDGDEEAERAPESLETILAPEHRISIRELVEEELLLGMPIVPLHQSGDCVAAAPADALSQGTDAEETRQRPFERLGELLNRKR